MVIVALFICLAVACLGYAVLSRPAPVAQRRLAQMPGMQVAAALSEEESQPARSDLLKEKLQQMLPGSMRERLQQFILSSGMKASPENVLIGWTAIAAGLPGLYLFSAVNSANGIGSRELLFAAVMALISAFLPFALLRSRGKRRRHKMSQSLPDTMDLMVTCVEAGLGIDAALARVAEKAKEPLGSEIRLVLSTMSMGRTRREALELLATRTGLPELSSFAGAVVQAEQMGVSLGQVLRVQAEALRTQRKQRAEQAAYKAPVKIIVVLALFIFPSMFVVILGPAAIQAFGGGK